MGLTGLGVISLTGQAAVRIYDDRADHRVRAGAKVRFAGELERAAHPACVVGVAGQSAELGSGPRADLLEAVSAVHGPALRRQEGDFRNAAADRARHGVKRAGPGDGAALASQRAALRAATGLIQQPFGLIKLLLTRGENE